jgi:hypothetical protein
MEIQIAYRNAEKLARFLQNNNNITVHILFKMLTNLNTYLVWCS